MQNSAMPLVFGHFHFRKRVSRYILSNGTNRHFLDIKSIWLSSAFCYLQHFPSKRYHLFVNRLCIWFKLNVNIKTKSRMIKILCVFVVRVAVAVRLLVDEASIASLRFCFISMDLLRNLSTVLFSLVSTFIFRLFLCHCFISSYFIRWS